MRQNAYNIVFFLILAAGLTALWWYAEQNWFPKRDRPKKDAADVAAEQKEKEPNTKPTAEAVAALAGAPSFGVPPASPPKPKDEVKPPARPTAEAVASVTGAASFGVPPAGAPTPPTLIALGGDGFYNRVLLTTRGGAVQQVALPEFHEADRLGREATKDGNPVPLFLIPGVRTFRGPYLREDYVPPDLHPGRVTDFRTQLELAEPSYAMFHYRTADDKYPDPLLGTTNWKVVGERRPDDGPHEVAFEAELPDPYFLKIRKTYTLGRKDYHVGLRIEFERVGGQKGKGQVRFQISGPRGLPVEGEWYTSTTRVALVGWETPKGSAKRQYEDAASIGIKRGGEPVFRADNTFKYAAIETQYFSSALAVDEAGGGSKNPWNYVRATSELPFLPPADEIKTLEELVKDHPDDKSPHVELARVQLKRINEIQNRNLPELDDITFRAVSDQFDLAPGERVVHSYAIYNGPTKVRLLKLLRDDKAVDSQVVDRYLDGFMLRTLTDFRSPTGIGAFADAIYWTDLVIVFTNVMHYLLWAIHWVIGSWGVSIIVLTVMVRLLLFFPSRKQTQMNLRMMEIQKRLKPELDRLHEKYKDDFQTYNREKTRLMMQHGMNPLAAMGGCLLLFAQMPIMMGLYFCLQESIFFRLEPFLWIDNLAAPDMTLWWSEKIPLISSPDNRYGGFSFLYLGPYLNILPLIAVGLMLYQQVKMMPPPTDEQMAAQQRMMKIMMGVMALMFYKVAAGLALYFIISTLWGIIERQFIPKPDIKSGGDAGTTAGLLPKGGPGAPAAPERAKGMLGRLREKLQQRLEELQKQAEEQSSRQVKNPNRNEPIRNPDRPFPPDRRDRKKRRRK